MNAVRTRAARLLIGVVTTVTALLVTAGPVSAHARVVRTTPGSGATIDGRLKAISVVFDDPVEVVPRSLVVTGETGAPQTIGAPRVLGGRILQASVSDRLPAGRYFVGWRVLADDGHIESGSFGFTVTTAATGSAGAASRGTVDGGGLPAMPAEPVWPVVVAAVMAAIACLGAALVVARGLAAVRADADTAGSTQAHPVEEPTLSTASTPVHTASRH